MLVALVVAQTIAIGHDDAHDLHPADDVCAICVSAASLGSGEVPTLPVVAPVARAEHAYDVDPAPLRSVRVRSRLARGPPSAS